MPVRDALDNIGHDYGCNDNHYTSLNFMMRQTHIVHRGRPGLCRNSGTLGDSLRKQRELLFIHSKLKYPFVNCGDKKEECSNKPQFLS